MSAAAPSMAGHDLYLRRFDTAGRSTVQQHRVWDVRRFLAAQVADADRLNAGVVGDGLPRKARIEVIDRQTYLATHRKN